MSGLHYGTQTLFLGSVHICTKSNRTEFSWTEYILWIPDIIYSFVLCFQRYAILGNLAFVTVFSVKVYSFLGHVSRLGIHVSMCDWFSLRLSLLWHWHGLSEDLSTNQAQAVCLSHCSQQSPGPKKHQQALGLHITLQSPLATPLSTGQLQGSDRTNTNPVHMQNTWSSWRAIGLKNSASCLAFTSLLQ